MQTAHLWHSLRVHWRKIALPVVLLVAPLLARGQYSIYENDLKYSSRPFHFGVTLGYNKSNFKITLDSAFISQKRIMNVQTAYGPGFNLGIISDLHLSKYFDLRFIPDLSFGEKNINYTQKDTNGLINQKVESVYLDFPIHLKYKSKPYKDFRMYILAGFKYSIDMQSNATARRAEDKIKIAKNDYSFEYGVGLEFHLPLVIISPEVKISYGLNNILVNDDNLIYSAVLKSLRSRCILFSIHFEG